jgi:hypothetical protein
MTSWGTEGSESTFGHVIGLPFFKASANPNDVGASRASDCSYYAEQGRAIGLPVQYRGLLNSRPLCTFHPVFFKAKFCVSMQVTAEWQLSLI